MPAPSAGCRDLPSLHLAHHLLARPPLPVSPNTNPRSVSCRLPSLSAFSLPPSLLPACLLLAFPVQPWPLPPSCSRPTTPRGLPRPCSTRASCTPLPQSTRAAMQTSAVTLPWRFTATSTPGERDVEGGGRGGGRGTGVVRLGKRGRGMLEGCGAWMMINGDGGGTGGSVVQGCGARGARHVVDVETGGHSCHTCHTARPA